MTTTQFYREPMSVEDASLEIEVGANKKYYPKLVEAFKKALPVMKKVREAYSDALGDMINLDFAPGGRAAAPAAAKLAPKPAAAAAPVAPPPAKPKVSAADLARAAAAKRK